MKKIAISILASGLLLSACKKTSELTETQNLKVEQKNMSVVAKHTWQGCPPCGDWGWNSFDGLKSTYGGKEVLLAFKLSNGSSSPFRTSQAEDIYSFIKDTFNIEGGTPSFHNNFVKNAPASVIDEHKAAPVVANANYDLKVSGNQINIKTTSQFFTTTEGDFYMIPMVVVDSVKAYQSNHPDGADTYHRLVPMAIATPENGSNALEGYKIATGKIKNGYTVNLDLKATRDLAWEENKISLAIIIVQKEEDGTMKFINAFTK